MKSVKATGASSKLRVNIKELGRIAKEGETFKVTDDRYRILSGGNRFKAKFVELVPEPKSTVKSDAPSTKSVNKSEPSVAAQSVEKPEIILIEPGKPPVKVDENLKPIEPEVKEKPLPKKDEPAQIKAEVIPETVIEDQVIEVTQEPEKPASKKSKSLKVESLKITEESDAKLDTSK